MSPSLTIFLSGCALSMAAVGPSFASTALLSEPYSTPKGGYVTDTSFSSTSTFKSGKATPIEVAVDVQGYLSLDGKNNYEDDFTLTLNDISKGTSTILVDGTFNLGGGGANVIKFGTGVTYSGANPNPSDTPFTGGDVKINISPALKLIAGDQYSLTYGYTSLSGGVYPGVQGLGDEGWGVNSVSVTAVPEPATWALMLAGFGGLGAALRMRRRNTLAIAAA